MRIIQALPRRMAFEARRSSSVELCVAEWVSGSRFRDQTTVFAERSTEKPLIDVDIHRLDPARRLTSWQLALEIRRQVREKGYKLIVTQQHIPTAARIAWFNPGVPVVLQTHNFIDPPVSGKGAWSRNRLRQFELNSLAGITLVSEAVLKRFEKEWPGVTIPRTVISNSFDFSAWRLDRPKENLIIVVGRADKTKGILEAAHGIATFIADHPDWKAAFILSATDVDKVYVDSVRHALAPLGDKAEILAGIPFSEVRELTEKASISIVASKWEEPFGRTALEAHAAGTALISSGTGGLKEISGDDAYLLPEVSGPAIAKALQVLAADPDLRRSLAERAAARVRRLFSLVPHTSADGEKTVSMSERLDRFYERVLASRK